MDAILSISYEKAASLKANLIWDKLDAISVDKAIGYWLTTLSPKTSLNYQSGMEKLIELGLVDPLLTLQQFALIHHEAIIDQIKLLPHWSENTKQARAACYISFTGFLSRRLAGIFRKAVPNKEGHAKTFFNVYEKVKTNALTQAQWIPFFHQLHLINPRDCLIAKVILQGAKRISEVLSLKTEKINWHTREITFTQAKMGKKQKETIITYSEHFLDQLKQYIGNRSGFVFITKSGKPVMPNQTAITFAKAGKSASIPFKVTPHVLRASAVTYLKQQGFQDSDIMRVTGHATPEMVYAYDKSSRAENASKKVNLLS